MSVGNNIKKLRELRGIDQYELAEELNVTQKAVSAWETERNQPRMGMIEKLSVYFKIPKSELLEDEITMFALNRDFNTLSAEQKATIMEHIKFLTRDNK